MPASTARRPSLCLFCSIASSSRVSPRFITPPSHLLPFISYTQTAHRNTRAFKPRDFVKGKGNRPYLRDRDGARRDESIIPFGRALSVQLLLQKGLKKLQGELMVPDFLESIQLTPEAFNDQWNQFLRYVKLWVQRNAPELRDLHSGSKIDIVQSRLRYLFYAQVYSGRITQAEVENQKQLADLRYPTEWYPATREIQREVHLHVGPTNSGKTYHALKRLEGASRGIYLGPLRLLAHEVYTRLNAKGYQCALVTGEELRLPEGEPNMWSCTVEMAPLNTPLEVAVIDEIQMINHSHRGWAWTQAFLGVQAKEIHLCGEARTVDIIRELCALTGDKVHVHNYERLTPLQVAKRSLGGLKSLEKGDCIVAFSVLGIHALRRQIEGKTNRKCAIVYGSLPPETRAQQARLFNDPDNDYDYLVASDAVGMGLNLSIKRVIFESTIKRNEVGLAPLNVSEMKQIAGRAGRYKTSHQAILQGTAQASEPDNSAVDLDDTLPKNVAKRDPDANKVGYVTTLEEEDFDDLKKGMSKEPESITTAGLFPPSLVVERFANYFPPGTPFSYILVRLHEICNVHPRFHLCGLKDQLNIADAIHLIKNLTIHERIVMCAAPTNVRDVDEKAFLVELASCIADNKSGNLLNFQIPLEVLDEKPTGERAYLFKLEQLHKMLVLYLWLSYRFPNILVSRPLANYTKKLVEDAIEHTLSQFSYTEKAAKERRQRLREAVRKSKMEEEKAKQESHDMDADLLEDVPEEVRDVIRDESLFVEDNSSRDDVDEYPSPELREQQEQEEMVEPQDPRKNLHYDHSRSGETQPRF